MIEADSLGRYPQDTETTVYFCTLEALQNIAKYASASQATVRLACPGGSLQFTITDDGTGSRHRHRHGMAPACKAWPTGSPPSAAPWPSAPSPDTAPP